MIRRNSVVLPAPFGPTTPIFCPRQTPTVTASKIGLLSPSKVRFALRKSSTSKLLFWVEERLNRNAFRCLGLIDFNHFNSRCERIIMWCFWEIDLSYLFALFIDCKAPVTRLISLVTLSILSSKVCKNNSF